MFIFSKKNIVKEVQKNMCFYLDLSIIYVKLNLVALNLVHDTYLFELIVFKLNLDTLPLCTLNVNLFIDLNILIIS